MQLDKQKKEPLIHITKRKMISKKHEWAIRLGSIVIALIVCAIITTITTHLNPITCIRFDVGRLVRYRA